MGQNTQAASAASLSAESQALLARAALTKAAQAQAKAEAQEKAGAPLYSGLPFPVYSRRRAAFWLLKAQSQAAEAGSSQEAREALADKAREAFAALCAKASPAQKAEAEALLGLFASEASAPDKGAGKGGARLFAPEGKAKQALSEAEAALLAQALSEGKGKAAKRLALPGLSVLEA